MLHQQQLVESLQADDYQLNKLKELVHMRNGDFNQSLFDTYLAEGIFWSESLEMFEDVLSVAGSHPEDFGYEPVYILTQGYLVPVYDHVGYVLFFINYNGNREKNQKYFIAYPPHIKEQLSQIRVLGLQDTKEFIEKQRVFVTEGVFDRLRLKAAGLPVIATMGTQLTDYFVAYIQRYKEILYVGDQDEAGQRSFLIGRHKGLNMYKLPLPKEKDIDAFAANYPDDYALWLEQYR